MRARKTPADLGVVEARRICILKPSALGDVVQTLPLLPALRSRFPQAEISWVINRELREIVAGHPALHEVIPFDRRGGVFVWRRMWNDLRDRRFDLVLDLQGLLRTGLMSLATAAPLRVGLQTAREWSHRACHLLIPDTGRDVPAHARYWRVAEAFGVGHLPRVTTLPLTEEHRNWARQTLAPLVGPLLVVNPGARWVTKRWPAEKFAVVASKAYRKYGCAAVIVGSPGERPLSEQLERLLQNFMPASSLLNLAGKTSLLQLGAVLESASVVLTNDSGPMHLAAGLGTPVVAAFTCTSSERSGPPGPQHALVSTNVSCAASYKKTCPHRGRRHLGCLEELDVDRVWGAFQSVADRLGSVRAA